MSRFMERVYSLLILTRWEMLKEFKVATPILLTSLLVNLIFMFFGWLEWGFLITWVVAYAIMGATFYFLDRNRLDIYEFEDNLPDETESVEEADEPNPTHTYIEIESSEDDMQYFSFNDLVTDTFRKKDSEAMSALLSNRHETLLKEV